MTEIKNEIRDGIYLVIDPSMEKRLLLERIEMALMQELSALQIWDNFFPEQDIRSLIEKVCELCRPKNVPVLINNKWEFLKSTTLNGVHFDQIPENFATIKKEVNRPFLSGLTCNNDLSFVRWAAEQELDYISFCSIFPSVTSNSCQLVNFSTIEQARKIYQRSIFLAGGIRPENIEKLGKLEYDGLAIISGIMSAERPDESIKRYYEKLKTKQ